MTVEPFSLIGASLENKTPAETFPKFPSVLRVIDRSDRNPPITVSRQFFNQRESKPNLIASCIHAIFSRALRKLQVTVRNSDWFVALFSPMVIGQANYFGSSSSNVI